MYKFFGTPLQAIKSKTTYKTLFVFDTKGEFITDDAQIIERALGFFDYIKLDDTIQTKEKIKKTYNIPPIIITSLNENDGTESKIEYSKHCKKCEFECNSQGELLSHYREKHPREV